MAVAQVGNKLGVSQVSSTDAKIAEITADGVDTVSVSAADVRKLRIGQRIVFRVKSTGAGFGTNFRTITGLTSAGVVTYDGADIATVAGTHAIYSADAQPYATNSVARNVPANMGGSIAGVGGGGMDQDFGSIEAMRDALKAISGTAYSDANLNLMTENDTR
jgi:hypothetical protein